MLKCNIDRTGRLLRAASGSLCLAAAVGCWWIGRRGVAGALLVLALFQFFEAAKGWCAMRAMGFRTKF
ncbi:MAG: DUF2892 domain-containing protein [Verrucomicrobia bacterium]|nr:DUF2892 domain-containing protein [Verrucomicrobiota bacterium]MCX6910165.1 DUF2892 domain-containing protein [Verrucomicrobiota bacterium]